MPTSIRFFNAVIVVSIFVVGVQATVRAHHSYAAFDMTKTVTIKGTVKKVDWTNPHTWLWLDVTNDKGGVETWGIEGMSPNYLSRRGWTKNTLKPDEMIAVVISPLRDGSHAGSFRSATRANGESLTMTPPIAEP